MTGFPATELASTTISYAKQAWADFWPIVAVLVGIGLAIIIGDWLIDLPKKKDNLL